jgi:hypothetical protein
MSNQAYSGTLVHTLTHGLAGWGFHGVPPQHSTQQNTNHTCYRLGGTYLDDTRACLPTYSWPKLEAGKCQHPNVLVSTSPKLRHMACRQLPYYCRKV